VCSSDLGKQNTDRYVEIDALFLSDEIRLKEAATHSKYLTATIVGSFYCISNQYLAIKFIKLKFVS
jgi:hypothetical protein